MNPEKKVVENLPSQVGKKKKLEGIRDNFVDAKNSFNVLNQLFRKFSLFKRKNPHGVKRAVFPRCVEKRPATLLEKKDNFDEKVCLRFKKPPWRKTIKTRIEIW